MAVTTTPRTIVNAAYATNAENRPEYIATGETELLDVVSRGMRKLYALAASLNPTYFGTTGDVAFAAGGWTRPEDAEAVFRIEDSDDEEVLVVPFDDRTLYGGDPAAVYFLGRKFYGAGNQGDPTSGTLTFWYSRRPTTPADLDTVVDADWPEQFNMLLILYVVRYLEFKDGRVENLPALDGRITEWEALYATFLTNATANETRRFEAPRSLANPGLTVKS